MFPCGPKDVRLALHLSVVLVGTLIRADAVNTAIVGANGVLDLTSRVLTLVAALQIVTGLLSRGNVMILAEAYAFGVV